MNLINFTKKISSIYKIFDTGLLKIYSCDLLVSTTNRISLSVRRFRLHHAIPNCLVIVDISKLNLIIRKFFLKFNIFHYPDGNFYR